MNTVFLTGASGFIGSYALKSLLERGYKVYAVSSKAQIPEQRGVEWVQLNLLDEKASKDAVRILKPTHLLHLAWYAEPPFFWESDQNLLWLESSLHLFKAFIESGGRRAVIAGTCAEYQWVSEGKCSETETHCLPNSLYGRAKYSLFLLTQKLCALTGISCAWGRLFHLYGPGEHPKKIVRSVISSLLQGRKALCSSGEQLRDYLHVADAADALCALLDSAIEGPVNIGCGKPIQIRDILKKIGEKIGKEELIQLGSIPVSSADPAILVPCTGRLANDVKWSPRIDLSDGLEQMIEWMKDEIHNRHG